MPETSTHRIAVLAEEIIKNLIAQRKYIVFAESCTAGLASDFLARVPCASEVFWGSFITYTAEAKSKMLGIPADFIKKHGEVSREVALAMAEGALEKSGASWAFSITGFAGPGGDSIPGENAVGTVWIGIAGRDEEPACGPGTGETRGTPICPEAKVFRFPGSRNEVREAAAVQALEEVLGRISRIGDVLGY
ncbi:MAG: CinA family protein [Treponema sp.]|jgi:PncC family amidohydrolase|nr:CinA family protein [Treponema sp.]